MNRDMIVWKIAGICIFCESQIYLQGLGTFTNFSDSRFFKNFEVIDKLQRIIKILDLKVNWQAGNIVLYLLKRLSNVFLSKFQENDLKVLLI